MSVLDIILIFLLFILIIFILILIFKITELKNSQDEFSRRVEETRKEVSDSIATTAKDTIESIYKVQQVAKELSIHQEDTKDLARSLKYLLQSPKHRGMFGEEIMEEMLEDMLPPNLWDRQYSIAGSEKVDAIIKFKGLIVPIDSKFPKEQYENYIFAKEQQVKRNYWKEYVKVIKGRIREIKSKYILPEAGTTDFALMFIPSESIYYEIISIKNFLNEKNDLYNYARENKVFPISPNTLYIYVQFILKSIQELKVLEKAKEIQKGLIDLDKNFEKFFSKYDEIGQSIEKAQNAYNISKKHINSFKKKLDSTVSADFTENTENDD